MTDEREAIDELFAQLFAIVVLAVLIAVAYGVYAVVAR